jgi:hypothetical protein
MFKKILIASVTTLGLAVPFTATPAANAEYHREFEHRHRCCYEVMFRGCDREPWRCEGTFESRHRAFERAEHLRHRGFEVRVVERG